MTTAQTKHDVNELRQTVDWFEGHRGTRDMDLCKQYAEMRVVFHHDVYYVTLYSNEFSSSWGGRGRGSTLGEALRNVTHRDSCFDKNCTQDHAEFDWPV